MICPHCHHEWNRGSDHHLAKLTDAQRIELARRRAAGGKVEALAMDYGVTTSTVSRVARMWAERAATNPSGP